MAGRLLGITILFAVAIGTSGCTRIGDLEVRILLSGEGTPNDQQWEVQVQAVGTGFVRTQRAPGPMIFSLTGLARGNWIVSLSAIPDNCTVLGSNAQTVSIQNSSTHRVAFGVECEPLTGSLTVSNTTQGDPQEGNPSFESYTVELVGHSSGPRPLPPNSTVEYPMLPVGDYDVEISGVPAHCSLSGNPVRSETVNYQGSPSIEYLIDCTGMTGTIRVETQTEGSDFDPDGYTVTVAGQQATLAATDIHDFTSIPEGTYDVLLSDVAPNCRVPSGENPMTAVVVADQPTPVTFVITCGSPATAIGSVVNALTGAPIAGAVVRLLEGLDAPTTDPEIAEVTTGTDGTYLIETSAGAYTFEVSAAGFSGQERNVTLQGGATAQDFALVPPLNPGQILIVLQWGAQPADLDSHLWGPDGGGGTFHVFYDADRFPAGAGPPETELSVDDTNGFGPETTTINLLREGRYCFAVHKDVSDPAAFDDATVRLVQDDGTVDTFSPTPTGPNTLWTVFTLDIAANGDRTVAQVDALAGGAEPTDPPGACGI